MNVSQEKLTHRYSIKRFFPFNLPNVHLRCDFGSHTDQTLTFKFSMDDYRDFKVSKTSKNISDEEEEKEDEKEEKISHNNHKICANVHERAIRAKY